MPPPMNCRLMCSQWFAERNKGIFSTHALAMFFNPSLGRTSKQGLELSYQGPHYGIFLGIENATNLIVQLQFGPYNHCVSQSRNINIKVDRHDNNKATLEKNI